VSSATALTALQALNALFKMAAPELAVGIAPPAAADAKWSKRQVSRMYNPMPASSDIDVEVAAPRPPAYIAQDRLPQSVIAESQEEAGAVFHATAAAPAVFAALAASKSTSAAAAGVRMMGAISE
jgi:hypothetical protein